MAKKKAAPKLDARFVNNGTICTIYVYTEAAKDWVNENVQTEGWQWMGNGFSGEPRMMLAVAEGMQADGLVFG